MRTYFEENTLTYCHTIYESVGENIVDTWEKKSYTRR